MTWKKLASLSDYLTYISTDEQEARALYEDLLIKVTGFFRDPEVFETLKDFIIPRILQGLPNQARARVWAPGCSSGEEAYSIAMCFAEASRSRENAPVQIFATDISDECIAKARAGLYPESIEDDVSPDRLQRFFKKDLHGYRVTRSIREVCVFARQNILSDPPFARIDLLSCRNLLIYIDAPAQKEVLYRLHYALKPTGFLLLGTAESVAAAPDLFREAYKKQRIYMKVPTGRRFQLSWMLASN